VPPEFQALKVELLSGLAVKVTEDPAAYEPVHVVLVHNMGDPFAEMVPLPERATVRR
jgi:hypothetical protein